ncbi:MAG: hypothetical protein WC827_04155 [Candidatus Paceibacterota bacterium]|jgi:hypothetical protein
MKIIQEQIVCQNDIKYENSKRTKPFNLIKVIFNYKSDKDDRLCLDELIKKGNELSINVNAGTANNATLSRNEYRIKTNCVAGVIAEYAWKKILNLDKETVSETPFEGANNQIDLKIISNSKKIEVRSSFPRNGIKFAICHPNYQFDVIGPYNNNYKPEEIQKDFYVRTLFPFDSSLVLENLKLDGFEVYLTGGATWEMMTDNNISIIKDFIPDGEISNARLTTKSSYRVVPFSDSLDTLEILKLVK